MGYWLVNHRPGSDRWRSAGIDLVDELVLHKNGQSRNNKYLHTVLNNMILLCTKYYQNWLINVDDIASQCHFWAWLKRPLLGVYDLQGSAETLVRRGGITNYHLTADSFSNISAKNSQNRLMGIEVIVWNKRQCFLRHSVFHPFAHTLRGCVCTKFGVWVGVTDMTRAKFLPIG